MQEPRGRGKSAGDAVWRQSHPVTSWISATPAFYVISPTGKAPQGPIAKNITMDPQILILVIKIIILNNFVTIYTQ